MSDLVTVIVDREIGTTHPEHADLYYPVNYGHIAGLMAPDGEEQDAYILGVPTPLKEFSGKLIAIVHRKKDIEDKWVVVPENSHYSRVEIEKQVHFQEQYFDIEIECFS